MGVILGTCQCCAADKIPPTSVQAVSKDALASDRRARKGTEPRKNSKKMPSHEGQQRALLQIKEGGFSLKNFAATNPGKVEDFYNVSSKVIGEGAFGKVMVATDKSTSNKRAVKSIQKSATQEVKKMQEELNIIGLLDHPNIVRLFESFEDNRSIYLVMELCDGGELFERIVEAGSFTEKIAAYCVKQMLLAINYLHQNLVVHRDLKPENWLVASKYPIQESSLKLIDFGISKRLKPGGTATSKAGTPNYVAPEVMTGRYNEKVDVWSTAVITYIMLTGLQPFNGRTSEEILAAVQRAKVGYDGKAFSKISKTCTGFMKSLFQKAISARPSAAQALQHDWLKNDAQTGEFLSQIEIQNLKSFSNFHKVKKGALTVIASQLSDSRIEDLKKTFLGIDQNADGTLSIAELKQGLKTAGIKIPRDLAQVLEQVDTDGSGVLDYTEFLAATIDKKVYTQEAIVWAAFRKFDRDGSGSIDKNELMNVLGDDALKDEFSLIGDQDELSKIFNEIDVNGDGVIDFEEFFAMVRVAEEGARDSVQDKPRRSPKTGPMQSPKGSKNSPKGSRQQSKTSPENSRNASPKQTVNIGLGAVSQSPAYM